MEWATLIGGQKIFAHSPVDCRGPHCCIHNPSQHHMGAWEQFWRSDTGVMERICPHGVGHPDPDHLASLEEEQRELDGIHGCDGCCRKDSNL